ncbi:MAG: hypothetical protein JSV31_16900 [Desulfobacterales bacterium]|nr:MAG: hypothetical protein JSV31_16900 [Desulfobacterales bacterium]
MKKFVIILVIVLLPSIALADFSIKFENTFNKKVFYFLYWIDHPYNWPAPANMAGGELEALEAVTIGVRYQNGKYRVMWRDEAEWQNHMMFNFKKDTGQITVSPEKVVF